MALPNLSHLRPGVVVAVAAVGAPTSPKRAASVAPDNGLWASLPDEIIDNIKQVVLESGDPESMCVTFARLCALNRDMCEQDVYYEALVVLKMPRNTPPQPGVSWKARFNGVCREDAALRRVGEWMRRGILTASLDWEDKKFQLHTAVRRLEAIGLAHLAWLMRARGGNPSFAHAPVPDGTKLHNFPWLSAENNYTHSDYGPIAEWDVADVKSMSGMFMGATSFNGDISKWDVSNVKTMNLVFAQATSFNGDLSKWDVSNVKKMNLMFAEATSFNGDLSKWDVSSVKTMSFMFNGAARFNGDLSKWDVSNVTNMRGMFAGATSFDVANHAPWYT